MPASFSIQSSIGPYGVTIAAGSFPASFGSSAQAYVIADEYFRSPLSVSGMMATFVEASETEKSLNRMPALIETLRSSGASRATELVAVGGGVVQDISAFVASIYMRGLKWTYVPTTVLGMVDSCIGGKSSINVGPYKNLVGTFHPPQHIHIDATLAETLPREQFASGLIEAAKICFCRGSDAFARYLSHQPSTSMGSAALEHVIIESLSAKKHFIEIDEFDQGDRLLLNFGHTFGHAIEGASHYAIPHGIAVGIGILCAFAFQQQRGIDLSTIDKVIQFQQHLREMIDTLPGVREELHRLQIDDVMQRFASDKKHTAGKFTLILLSERGDVILEKLNKSLDVEQMIRGAIETMIETT